VGYSADEFLAIIALAVQSAGACD